MERLPWRLLVLGISLLATIFGLLAPYAQKRFTEDLLAGGSGAWWIVCAFLCLIAYQLLWQINVFLSTRESLISQKALSDAAFHRLLEGPGGLVGREPTGVAVSLFAVDIPGAGALLEQSLLMASGMIFPIVLAPVALHSFFGIPWWASIGAVGFLAVVNVLLARRQSGYFLAFKQFAAERTGLVSEWVQNIRTLRILGWVEAAEQRIFALRRRETANRRKMLTNGQIMNSIATSSTFSLNLLAVMLLMHIRRIGGHDPDPTPGELLSLLWILGIFLTRPLRQMPWMLVMSFDALSSLQRLQRALNLPIARPTLSDHGGASARENVPGPWALEARGLSLESAGRPLLRSIDICLKKGSLTALVGEVGSGKSLLLQSLIGGTGARFDRFALAGESLQGPLDSRARGRLAFVPQEGFTISATLRENVLFDYLDGKGVSPSVDKGVSGSLTVCQFHPASERVPHGLDSEVGERGVNLSGGQRQRIGLARAHFASREIVLLDDCLSAVDVDTERLLIEKLICGAWKGETLLLATHRLSVLPHCDEVIFLNEGAIEARGTYEELLTRSPLFREFVRREDRTKESPSPAIEPLPGSADEGEGGTP
jgi:ABC-type multidrug transport system fused ATPase/permease subunit